MAMDTMMYELLRELAKDKHSQKKLEEALIRYLPKPIYRQWFDERVQVQLKHQRILKEICKEHLEKELEWEESSDVMQMKRYVSEELEERLIGVSKNINLLSQTMQSVENFKIYKMLHTILIDEQLYEGQLIRLLNQR